MNPSEDVNGPFTRSVKLRVAHAPGIRGTFSPPPCDSDPDLHHGTCVTHVPWCMPGSLNSGFLWNRWRGKRTRHSRRMRIPQFKVPGKRPMGRKPDSRTFTKLGKCSGIVFVERCATSWSLAGRVHKVSAHGNCGRSYSPATGRIGSKSSYLLYFVWEPHRSAWSPYGEYPSVLYIIHD